jgi:hypothetical protein
MVVANAATVAMTAEAVVVVKEEVVEEENAETKKVTSRE